MSSNICIFEPLMAKNVFTELARDIKLSDIDFSNGSIRIVDSAKNASVSQSINEKSTSSLSELPEPNLSIYSKNSNNCDSNVYFNNNSSNNSNNAI